MSDVETNIHLEIVHTRTHRNVSTVGGDHSAAYNGCKEGEKVKEIQKIQVVNKLSYAEATNKWRENENATKIPTEGEKKNTSSERDSVYTPK